MVKSSLAAIVAVTVVTCGRPQVPPVSRSLAIDTVSRASLSIEVVKRGDVPRDLSAPGWLDRELSAKAMIRIPEYLNWEIVPGLPVTIHLPDHTAVSGRVLRSDPPLVSQTHPSSIAGTHLIEVRISDSLPRDMHTEAPVDGTFHLPPLRNVLFITRPTSLGGSTMRIFRLVPNSGWAEQTSLQFGRFSDTMIEIEGGATLGDSLIVSDMVRFGTVDRVRIK